MLLPSLVLLIDSLHL
jgi:hypothetical protein